MPPTAWLLGGGRRRRGVRLWRRLLTRFAGGDGPGHPTVAMAADTATGGYWLVRPTPPSPSSPPRTSVPWPDLPAGPVVGIAATADGNGCWEVTRRAAVYAYGDAAYRGPAMRPRAGRAHRRPHRPAGLRRVLAGGSTAASSPTAPASTAPADPSAARSTRCGPAAPCPASHSAGC